MDAGHEAANDAIKLFALVIYYFEGAKNFIFYVYSILCILCRKYYPGSNTPAYYTPKTFKTLGSGMARFKAQNSILYFDQNLL